MASALWMEASYSEPLSTGCTFVLNEPTGKEALTGLVALAIVATARSAGGKIVGLLKFVPRWVGASLTARHFNRVFAQVAADYLADDEQPEDLVAELLTTLHRAGPLEWQGSDGTALATEVSEAHLELDDTSPRLLAEMIDSPPDTDSLWTSADLGDYLRHLLTQPIGVALGYSHWDMPQVLQG